MICKIVNKTVVSDLVCEAKYIDRYRNMKGYVCANLSMPLKDIWMHAVVYYRFNGLTYSKFPVDLWEDACGWFAGTAKSYILDGTIGRLRNYKIIDTNINHACPYLGHVYAKADNISTSRFKTQQILPSGKFCLDVNLTNGYRKNVLATAQLFGSISDHRVEQF